MGFAPQYCPICGKELTLITTGIYGGTVTEHTLICPTRECYSEEYYQGLYSVYIGEREFQWVGEKPAELEAEIERIKQTLLDRGVQGDRQDDGR